MVDFLSFLKVYYLIYSKNTSFLNKKVLFHRKKSNERIETTTLSYSA